MRRLLLVLFLAAPLAAFLACVGDDPGGAATPNVDASTDGPGTQADGDVTDAGADAAQDAKAPYDVRALSGLRLWLESTNGLTKAAVGNDLVAWRDATGRWDAGGATAPDGGAHLVTQDPQPLPGTSGGLVSVLTNSTAGRPALQTHNPGFRAVIANHSDFEVGKGDFAIVAVAKVASGTGPLWRLMTQTSVPMGIHFSPTEVCWLFGARTGPKCTAPTFTPNTEPHVFVARRKSVQLLFRVDGTTRGDRDLTVDDPDLSVLDFQQPRVFIGGNTSLQISELLYIVGPTDDATLTALETHLKQKYAIP